MKKFKIKERRVLFASNETLNNQVDTESILLNIRKKYGLIEDTHENLTRSNSSNDPSISQSSVDDPHGVLKIHHIITTTTTANSRECVSKRQSDEDLLSAPTDLITKSLFNLTEPFEEDKKRLMGTLLSPVATQPSIGPDVIHWGIKPTDTYLENERTTELKIVGHPADAPIPMPAPSMSLTSNFKYSALSDPISYSSTPRQSTSKIVRVDKDLEVGEFLDKANISSTGSNLSQGNLPLNVVQHDYEVVAECISKPVFAEPAIEKTIAKSLLRANNSLDIELLTPSSLINDFDQIGKEGFTSPSRHSPLVSSTRNHIDQKQELFGEISNPDITSLLPIVQSDVAIISTNHGRETISNLKSIAVDEIERSLDVDLLQEVLPTSAGSPLKEFPCSVIRTTPHLTADYFVQSIAGFDSFDAECQTDTIIPVTSTSCSSQTDSSRLANQEIQTIPFYTASSSIDTQTLLPQLDLSYARKLSFKLENDDESRLWLRQQLKYKLDSLE